MSFEPDIPRSNSTDEIHVEAGIPSKTNAAGDDFRRGELLHLMASKGRRSSSSPSWNLFSLYHPKHHPAHKQSYARCDICGKDVKIFKPSRGDNPITSNLTSHLKAKHSRVYDELMAKHAKNAAEGLGRYRLKYFEEEFIRDENDVGRQTTSAANIGAINGGNEEGGEHIPQRHDDNKEVNQKQQMEWMDSWDNARTRLNRLIKEFHEEQDEFVRAEIKNDAMKMRKRKAHFEELLGMQA
mmetsp:Transcript_5954/g.12179  ORF Transcript_5954/g.12179 Transcript_5954/m.12179 type:complete len:240 (+) Transcript_5954:99-818(+)